MSLQTATVSLYTDFEYNITLHSDFLRLSTSRVFRPQTLSSGNANGIFYRFFHHIILRIQIIMASCKKCVWWLAISARKDSFAFDIKIATSTLFTLLIDKGKIYSWDTAPWKCPKQAYWEEPDYLEDYYNEPTTDILTKKMNYYSKRMGHIVVTCNHITPLFSTHVCVKFVIKKSGALRTEPRNSLCIWRCVCPANGINEALKKRALENLSSIYSAFEINCLKRWFPGILQTVELFLLLLLALRPLKYVNL